MNTNLVEYDIERKEYFLDPFDPRALEEYNEIMRELAEQAEILASLDNNSTELFTNLITLL